MEEYLGEKVVNEKEYLSAIADVAKKIMKGQYAWSFEEDVWDLKTNDLEISSIS